MPADPASRMRSNYARSSFCHVPAKVVEPACRRRRLAGRHDVAAIGLHQRGQASGSTHQMASSNYPIRHSVSAFSAMRFRDRVAALVFPSHEAKYLLSHCIQIRHPIGLDSPGFLARPK
jgi:hypothetical protein